MTEAGPYNPFHTGSTMATTSLSRRTVRIHGHDVSYRMAGEGPTIVLIHGIAGSSTTWPSLSSSATA